MPQPDAHLLFTSQILIKIFLHARFFFLPGSLAFSSTRLDWWLSVCARIRKAWSAGSKRERFVFAQHISSRCAFGSFLMKQNKNNEIKVHGTFWMNFIYSFDLGRVRMREMQAARSQSRIFRCCWRWWRQQSFRTDGWRMHEHNANVIRIRIRISAVMALFSHQWHRVSCILL